MLRIKVLEKNLSICAKASMDNDMNDSYENKICHLSLFLTNLIHISAAHRTMIYIYTYDICIFTNKTSSTVNVRKDEMSQSSRQALSYLTILGQNLSPFSLL